MSRMGDGRLSCEAGLAPPGMFLLQLLTNETGPVGYGWHSASFRAGIRDLFKRPFGIPRRRCHSFDESLKCSGDIRSQVIPVRAEKPLIVGMQIRSNQHDSEDSPRPDRG